MDTKNYPITSDFFIHEKLGSGTYGDVYKGICKSTFDEKALKLFKLKENEFDIANINEITILLKLNHPNIIKIENVYVWKSKNGYKLAFTMPIAMSIKAWIRKVRSHFPADYKKHIESIIRQTTSALMYLHTKGFIHQDIKPQNILINEYGVVKLIDFGISIFIGNCKSNVSRINGEVQSLNYRSPELLHKGTCYYNNKIDTWALGCLFVELLSNNIILFNGENPEHILKSINSKKYVDYINNTFPEYSSIILSILEPVPTKRYSIDKFAKKTCKKIRHDNLKHLIQLQHPIKIITTRTNPYILNSMLEFLILEGYDYKSFAGSILIYRLVIEHFSNNISESFETNSSKKFQINTLIAILCVYISIGIYEGLQPSLSSIKKFLKKTFNNIKISCSVLLDYIVQILIKLEWNIVYAIPTDFIENPDTTDELLTIILMYNTDYTVYSALQLSNTIKNFKKFKTDNTQHDEFLMSSLTNALDMHEKKLFGPSIIYPKELKKIIQ